MMPEVEHLLTLTSRDCFTHCFQAHMNIAISHVFVGAAAIALITMSFAPVSSAAYCCGAFFTS
jgi:hypothetical protein